MCALEEGQLAEKEELRALLGFMTIDGIGPRAILKLFQEGSSFKDALDALLRQGTASQQGSWLFKGDKRRHSSIRPDYKRVDLCIREIERLGGWIISFKDEEYPDTLRNIHAPPPVLFGMGDKSVLSSDKCIAIIGARRATGYGQKAAFELARSLCNNGIIVVSGMAVGIDTFAHKGVLSIGDKFNREEKRGGTTIAVLGSGFSHVYPRENVKLMNNIIASGGAVITEFFPDTKPKPQNFPQRNRVISGLSLGVVVVEAGKRSGSLITASYALEQGKEVMAVPGSIYSYMSKGTHWLLKQGAMPVESADDILSFLGLHNSPRRSVPVHSGDNNNTKDNDKGDSGLSSPKDILLSHIGAYPIHIDELVKKTSLPLSVVSSTLMELELEGRILSMPGKFYYI